MIPAVSAVATDGKAPIAGGYCAVAYAKIGKAVKGGPQFASVVDGQTYHFVSVEAKKMFDAEPPKYPIAYQGYCATGVAMGKKLVSNPEIFTVLKGTTYLFSNAEARVRFDKDPDMTISKAAADWSKIK